ncbi:hypothetical protein BV898_14459 [Hypsibius exemplaris]|uniref:Uncharacterized protein n=1 Tax=Hypsibius exemplaris TaxID=2072580 RepID=A0A9X6RJK7_HYPEX|nr:hypothetical protein BV898_14459 [Hypsibius exemplaris]
MGGKLTGKQDRGAPVRLCGAPMRCASAVRLCGAPVRCANAVRQCGAPMRCACAVRQCGAPVRCAYAVRQCASAVRQCGAPMRCACAVHVYIPFHFASHLSYFSCAPGQQGCGVSVLLRKLLFFEAK